MNRRQLKKYNRKRILRFNEKVKAVVTIDLTHVTPGSHLDVYISNKFESDGTKPGESRMLNEEQKRYVSSEKVTNKGFTHAIYVKNGGDSPFGLTIWVNDADKSYYVIRPHREPEKGHSETTLEGEEVAL